MHSHIPYDVFLDKVPAFLVEEFGGESLIVLKGETVLYLEWSLPDFAYQFVNEHTGPARLLKVHIDKDIARITLLS